MKGKLKEYIDTIFADAERRSPQNRRLAELKEEMLQNLNDKYDDLIAVGKSSAAAYNIAIAGVGDVSDLIESIIAGGSTGSASTESIGTDAHDRRTSGTAEARPHRESRTPEQEEILRKYRERSAVLTTISVAMYILCAVPPILFGDTLGVVLMFIMIAAATSILIYNGMRKPKFGGSCVDDDHDSDEDDRDRDDDDVGRSPVYKAISGALWMLTVCVYLFVSFVTGWWHITWMIFLIVVAIDNIIKAIFDIRR